MGDNDKIVNVIIKYGVDEATARKVSDALKAQAKATKDTGEAADVARKRFREMRGEGERLQMLGLRMGAIGAAITGPLLLGMNAYIQKVGVADTYSRKWLVSNQKLEQSQLRVGRVVAQQLLPYMEKTAGLATQVASFLESNPDIIKAALVGGGILAAGGTALATIGTIQRTVASVGLLAKSFGLGGAVAGAGGAGAGVTGAGAAGIGGTLVAAAPAIGLAIGAAAATPIANAIYVAQGREERNILGVLGETAQTANRMFAIPSYLIAGKFAESLEKAGWKGGAEGLRGLVGKSAQLLGGAAPAGATGTGTGAIGAAGGIGPIDVLPDVKLLEQYRKQEKQSLQQLDKARLQITTDTDKRINKSEADYGKERTRMMRDIAKQQATDLQEFNKSRQRDEDSYYKDRMKQAKAHGVDIERAEAEHQKNIRRMGQDHGDRMEDFVASRDAIGAIQEMRNYEKERSRAEEDYHDSAKQQDEGFAAELKGNEAQYKERRAQELDDFKARMTDEKEQNAQRLQELGDAHKDELNQLKQNKQDQLTALQTNYDEQKTAQTDAYKEQMAALGIFLDSSRDAWVGYYQQLESDLEAIKSGGKIESYVSVPGGRFGTSTVKGRQAGGYMPRGLYSTSEAGTEFALNAQSTRGAESLLGGALSQTGILSALAAGRSGGSRAYNDSRNMTFYGTQNADEIRRIVRHETEAALDAFVRELGA